MPLSGLSDITDPVIFASIYER